MPIEDEQGELSATDGQGSADPADALRCSAKGCRAAATEDLSWRNPSIHDQARVKHWLGCPDHADFLADFLARRGFLLSRDPLPGSRAV